MSGCGARRRPEAQALPPAAVDLQRRLIVTVIGIVSLILVIVAVATSAILGSVLEEQLNDRLRRACRVARLAARIHPQSSPGSTAARDPAAAAASSPAICSRVSTDGRTADRRRGRQRRQGRRTDAARRSTSSPTGCAARVRSSSRSTASGSYRVEAFQRRTRRPSRRRRLPRARCQRPSRQMLTTIALLTLGGLLLLAAATAWTIRAGLAPLRAVADTADAGRRSCRSTRATCRSPSACPHARPTRAPRSAASARPSTPCSTTSTSRSTPASATRSGCGGSSPTRATSCARPSRRSAATRSSRCARSSQSHDPLTLETTESLARAHPGAVAAHDDARRGPAAARAPRRGPGARLRLGRPHRAWRSRRSATPGPPAPTTTGCSTSARSPSSIAGDAGRLHQVAANLLANARTHTPAGTTVTRDASRSEGTDAVLRVHDDGPGIDPAVSRRAVRALLARRPLARPPDRRHRTRAVDRPGDRRGARRLDLRVRARPATPTFEVRLPARANGHLRRRASRLSSR